MEWHEKQVNVVFSVSALQVMLDLCAQIECWRYSYIADIRYNIPYILHVKAWADHITPAKCEKPKQAATIKI